MRIAVTTYPMLWQRTGGLQVQILRTVAHLARKGVDARLFDSLGARLGDYDLVHVFSAINGAHLILREARAQNVPTVLSPILQPGYNWPKFMRYRAASSLTGKLTTYENRTTYDDILSAVSCSDRLIALSEAERRVLTNGYSAEDRFVTTIPNGVDAAFFSATPHAFTGHFNILSGFVLVVGSISSYKNQLGVIRATLQVSERDVLLIGPVEDAGYLERCLKEGGERVRHLGMLAHDDPLLGSAYASAGVTVLASAGETFGLTAVESLASGTPAIITAANGLGLSPQPPWLQYVDPGDAGDLGRAIGAALSAPMPTTGPCRQLVAHLDWKATADRILEVYRDLTGAGAGAAS